MLVPTLWLGITFQQPLPPSLFFALRTLAFPVDTVLGETLEDEKSTAKKRIGVKIRAFTMVSFPLLPTDRSNLRVPVTRECCQDLLRRRRLPDELGMTELAEKVALFSAQVSLVEVVESDETLAMG